MAKEEKSGEPSDLNTKFEMLLELLAAQAVTQQPITPETLKAIMLESSAVSANTMKRALKPENESHPGISACSYPEGDQEKPKQPMGYEFFYNGFPCHMFPETEHWREWELMSQVQPGEYVVLMKDANTLPVTVSGERDANLNLTKLSLTFPFTRENKNQIPAKQVLLYQVVHQKGNPRKTFMEAMQEYYAMHFGDVVSA